MYCLSRAWLLVPVLACSAIPIPLTQAAAYDARKPLDYTAGRGLAVTTGDQPASLGRLKQPAEVAWTGGQSVSGQSQEPQAAFRSPRVHQGLHLSDEQGAAEVPHGAAVPEQQAAMQNLAPEHNSQDQADLSSGLGLWLDNLKRRVRSRAAARREAQHRQLQQQAAAGGLFTSGVSPGPSTARSNKPAAAAAEDTADASSAADSTQATSSKLGNRSASGTGTMDVQADGGVPYSCMTGSYKYAQLEVVLDMPAPDPTQLSALQDKVSTAIAQQLQLTDDNGMVDTSRVETYVVTIDDSNDSVDLDVFIYLSSSNCEVFTHTWMQSVQDDPASLFRTDAGLQSAVVNVTANFADPGRVPKQLILASSNAVISVSLGVQAASGNTTAGSSATSLYNWFFSSGSVSESNVDGLMILGITTSALILVLVLLVLVQRYARRLASQRAEAEITAAAQAAALSARQQAALVEVPEQERGTPVAAGTHAAAVDASSI